MQEETQKHAILITSVSKVCRAQRYWKHTFCKSALRRSSTNCGFILRFTNPGPAISGFCESILVSSKASTTAWLTARGFLGAPSCRNISNLHKLCCIWFLKAWASSMDFGESQDPDSVKIGLKWGKAQTISCHTHLKTALWKNLKGVLKPASS